MEKSLSSFRYMSFEGTSEPSADELPFLEEAFRLWKAVWSKTFKELDGAERIYADDFTRQTKVGCVFDNGKCVAVVFVRMADFRFSASEDDSYFKVWPESAKNKLIAHGKRVAVGSYITVDEHYRGDMGLGLKLKDLLMGLALKESELLGADVMTGTLRCNRGMRSSGDRFGSVHLETTSHHGVEVDLVAFYVQELKEKGLFNSHVGVERLWRGRQDLSLLRKQKKAA